MKFLASAEKSLALQEKQALPYLTKPMCGPTLFSEGSGNICPNYEIYFFQLQTVFVQMRMMI